MFTDSGRCFPSNARPAAPRPAETFTTTSHVHVTQPAIALAIAIAIALPPSTNRIIHAAC